VRRGEKENSVIHSKHSFDVDGRPRLVVLKNSGPARGTNGSSDFPENFSTRSLFLSAYFRTDTLCVCDAERNRKGM
jgi:hypothetical protein